MGERKFLVGMIASMFCWGISWPVGKILSSYGIAENMAFLRFAVTFISLLFLLVILKEKLTILKKGIPTLLIASVLMTLYGYLFLKGLTYGKAGAGGVLVTTLNPILTYVLTMFIVMRLPSWKETIGLLVGLIAGMILLHIWDNSTAIFDKGNLYFVSATTTWAVLTKFTSMSARYGSPVTFSLWMYGICSMMMYVFVEDKPMIELLRDGDSLFWFSLFYSATITTSLATTFYFYARAKIGASRASSYIFMVPLSAAVGSWLILGEIPVWNTVVGGLLGIMAVYILNSNALKGTSK